MKALVWRGERKLLVEDRPMPVLGNPGDAIIRVQRSGICGSDLHLYHGAIPCMRKGDILGHEFMGVVEQVGCAVTSLAPGDRVVVAAVISCGACWYCEHELYSQCDTTNPEPLMQIAYGHHISGVFGYTHLLGGYDGGQAEYVRVPYADVGCLKLPDELPDDKAVLLGDAACTGWMAADIGGVCRGSTVAVWGAGPVGLCAMTAARTMGAERIFAIDNVRYRLEVARCELGAETINFDEDRPSSTLLEMTQGRGVDVCIEAVGFRYTKSLLHKVERKLMLETDSLDTISEMLRAVRKSGTISLMGDYIGYGNHFLIGALMEKGITIRSGQVHVQRYWHEVMERMCQGSYDPSFIVTHRVPLAHAPDAYRMFDRKDNGAIKVLLDPTQRC